MKIVFMGTPEFSVPAIDALLEAGHEIAAVFSQPDKPKGRGYSTQPTPVKLKAEQRGIPVFQPKTLRDGEAARIFDEINPDVAIIIAYGKLLPVEILQHPKYGCINAHASLLPKYRGAAPIQWSVLNGETRTGVTAMQMDVGMDTGDILMTMETDIDPDETSGELYDRLSPMAAELVVKTLDALQKGEINPVKQDDSLSCPAPMLTRELSPVDWSRSASEIHNQIRGLSPWPTATAAIEGKRVKLHKSAVSAAASGAARCGEIISLSPLTVQCGGNTAIEIVELQAEGKKRMKAEDYLRGHRISIGEVLE